MDYIHKNILNYKEGWIMNNYWDQEINNNIQYIKQLSKQYPTINSACTEVINLEAILNLPKGTEHYLSDIHGEYEAFIHVLNNASGVIRRKIDYIFDNTIREHEKRRLAMLIYYPEQILERVKNEEENLLEWYEITLHRLVLVCREISSKYTRSKVRKALPKDFEYIIEELLHEQQREVNKQEYYDGIINTIIKINRADNFMIAICRVIQRLAIDRLHIIGDIYDRGPGAHIILDKLMQHHSIDIQWGNHDILWMGAAAGSLACIASTIRISARYGNLNTIEEGYGINLLPLATFAMEYYKDDNCDNFDLVVSDKSAYTCKEINIIKKIHKAISIIQFKLEGKIIQRNPNYIMNDRLLLNMIDYEKGTIKIAEKTYKLSDNYFPTINPKNPYELTIEEKDVMEKLRLSYRNNEKLQKHTRFLFSKGSMYLTYNSNLLFHGCIPMDIKGVFNKVTIDGKSYSGKKLIDKIEMLIREYYFNNNNELNNIDYFWYLWTGPNSPLFGKNKMATFERYFLNDKDIKKEYKNSYYRYRDSEEKCREILHEFGISEDNSHIINGHVPVEVKKGESPIKAKGKLLVIDGGLSEAYQHITGIAGYTLIYNSYGLLMVAHEKFESKKKAIENEKDIVSSYQILEKNNKRLRVKNTDIGKELKKEIIGLKMLLQAYHKGIIKEK
jgi:fructose-1,6-bisphosphatase-3